MASKEKVEKILEKLEESNPVEFFKKVNELHMGIGAVLQLLLKSQGIITASQISQKLGVSTARTTVVLKKMEAKGLITKEKSIADGRVTIIKITELGEKTASKMRNEMRMQLEQIIDTIGEEKILQFIEISNEIKAIVKFPLLD